MRYLTMCTQCRSNEVKRRQQKCMKSIILTIFAATLLGCLGMSPLSAPEEDRSKRMYADYEIAIYNPVVKEYSDILNDIFRDNREYREYVDWLYNYGARGDFSAPESETILRHLKSNFFSDELIPQVIKRKTASANQMLEEYDDFVLISTLEANTHITTTFASLSYYCAMYLVESKKHGRDENADLAFQNILDLGEFMSIVIDGIYGKRIASAMYENAAFYIAKAGFEDINAEHRDVLVQYALQLQDVEISMADGIAAELAFIIETLHKKPRRHRLDPLNIYSILHYGDTILYVTIENEEKAIRDFEQIKTGWQNNDEISTTIKLEEQLTAEYKILVDALKLSADELLKLKNTIAAEDKQFFTNMESRLESIYVYTMTADMVKLAKADIKKLLDQ